jgi:hypothetical protein
MGKCSRLDPPLWLVMRQFKKNGHYHMTKKVTNIQDAKALRAMGAPLNTPVVDGGELPAVLRDGFKAAEKFRTRIEAYAANQNASTLAAMEKAFGRFMAKTVSDDRIGAAPPRQRICFDPRRMDSRL